MLYFMYAGSLSARSQQPDASVRALVDLLIVGDKFEVGSFMGAVLKALSKRERTVSDSVVLALGIPDVLQQHVQIKKVVEEARAHLVETFKDVEKWGESLQFLTLGQDVV
jgi:deoxyxylulose-5-phosphate synthase